MATVVLVVVGLHDIDVFQLEGSARGVRFERFPARRAG